MRIEHGLVVLLLLEGCGRGGRRGDGELEGGGRGVGELLQCGLREVGLVRGQLGVVLVLDGLLVDPGGLVGDLARHPELGEKIGGGFAVEEQRCRHVSTRAGEAGGELAGAELRLVGDGLLLVCFLLQLLGLEVGLVELVLGDLRLGAASDLLGFGRFDVRRELCQESADAGDLGLLR